MEARCKSITECEAIQMKVQCNNGIEYTTNSNGISMSIQKGGLLIDVSQLDDSPYAPWFNFSKEDLEDLFAYYVAHRDEIK